jgi:hypothetical protein
VHCPAAVAGHTSLPLPQEVEVDISDLAQKTIAYSPHGSFSQGVEFGSF